MSYKQRKYNKFSIIDDEIHMELTQGKTTIFDTDDLFMVIGYVWFAAKLPAGRKDGKDYYRPQTNVKGQPGKMMFLSRFLMDAPKGMQVDHIDHDPLNNRKSNLRICTQAQNNSNQRKLTRNTSGYTGVVRCGKSWRAQMFYKRKWYNLGLHDTKESAARAYDKRKIELYGEFAMTNEMAGNFDV